MSDCTDLRPATGRPSAPPRRGTGPAVPIAVVVSPWGRLDADHADAFRREMALLSALAGAEVVVDLSAVPVIDEAAAQCLSDAEARLRRNDGRLRLAHLRSQPRDALRTVGLGADGWDTVEAPAAVASGW